MGTFTSVSYVWETSMMICNHCQHARNLEFYKPQKWKSERGYATGHDRKL